MGRAAGAARRGRCGGRRGDQQRRLRRPGLATAHRDAHAVLLDRELAGVRLLQQAHEAAHAARLVVVEGILVADVRLAPAQALQERQGALAEERDEAEVLLEAARLPASSRASSSDGSVAVEAGARSAAASATGSTGAGGMPPLAEQQAAHVAVDLGPAARVQHVRMA